MKIVETLNTIFGMFDHLSDKNDIYKVETVKDSFVGVSGAPEKVCTLEIKFYISNEKKNMNALGFLPYIFFQLILFLS